MADAALRPEPAPSNLVKIPRPRKRRTCALRPEPAAIVTFPDKLGITAPAFDPSDETHQLLWKAMWETTRLNHARHAPEGHPLRAWWQADFAKHYPGVRKG